MFESFTDARRTTHDFFYRRETPFGLAILRIAMPLVMLTMIIPRWAVSRELFSADGATAMLAEGYGFPGLVPELPGTLVVALFSIMIFTLLTTSIGWMTRTSIIISNILFTYICVVDVVSTMTKYTVMMTHVMLILSLSDCGAIWSVDAWLKGRKTSGPAGLPVSSEAWPRRLIELLIGVIYFGAAITKMNTPTFLSGDQLQMWMLTHINFRHPLGEWLALYPVLLKTMGYTCLVWEMTFIFLVWRGAWRPIVLSIGIVFHFMTVVTLGLIVFPLTCYCCYLAFIDEAEFVRLRRWAKALFPQIKAVRSAVTNAISKLGDPIRWQRPARIAWPALVLFVGWSGVQLEYWVDPYDLRRAEGPHQLKPLDERLTAQLLNPTTKIRDKDKFFAIDTGTILVGDLLADRRRAYRYGEQMVIQCHLTPPHEDMWVECKILDGHNRLVDRTGSIAMREAFRVNFSYPVTRAMEPGDYTLIMETAGREVLRKKVTILDSPSVASTN